MDIMLIGHTVGAGSIPVAHTAFLLTENVAKIEQKYTEYTGIHVLVKSVGFQCPDAAYDIAVWWSWVPAHVSASSLDRGSKLRGPSLKVLA